MRLLIVSSAYYPFVLGGAEVSSQLLAEGLKKRIDVRVVTLGLASSEELVNGVQVRRVYLPCISEARLSEGKRKYLRQLKLVSSATLGGQKRMLIALLVEEVRQFRPDLVHFTNNLFPLPVRSVFKFFQNKGIPSVLTMRDLHLLGRKTLTMKKRIGGFYFRNALQFIDCIHFTTKTMLNKYESDLPAKSLKVVIPNAVGLQFIEKSWLITIEKKSFSNRLEVLFVGALDRKKGIDRFEMAAQNLLTKHPKSFRFWIVGRGNYEDRLLSRLSRFITDGSVKLVGWKPAEELEMLYELCHIVVLPSRWEEMFGRVLIEGFYRGCLPIGSKTGGIPEVIKDDELLFDSQEAMEGLLLKSKDNEWRRGKLLSLVTHMKTFSIDSHLDSMIDLYNQIMETRQ